MTALTTQSVVDAGTKPNFALQTATVADTAEIGSGHDTVVVYKNTDANIKTITITVPGNTDYGQANPDPALSLAASTGELWIPMRKDYNNGTGRADLAVSGTGGVTGVTVAVVRIS
jgi:hypothetical protein